MADLLNKTFKAVFTREEVGNILEVATKHVRSKLKTTSIRIKQTREKNTNLKRIQQQVQTGKDQDY
jgi:predicted nucleic acid-binding protein